MDVNVNLNVMHFTEFLENYNYKNLVKKFISRNSLCKFSIIVLILLMQPFNKIKSVYFDTQQSPC